jgi:hypothetical protein
MVLRPKKSICQPPKVKLFDKISDANENLKTEDLAMTPELCNSSAV